MNILCISKIYEKYYFSNNDLTSQITIRVFLIPYQHRSIKFGDPNLCENLAGRSIKRRSNRSSLKHKITLVAAGPYPKKNDLCLMFIQDICNVVHTLESENQIKFCRLFRSISANSVKNCAIFNKERVSSCIDLH